MDLLHAALNDADFQWTTHIETIWRDIPSDIPELQSAPREQIQLRLSALFRQRGNESPLGLALLGPGGSGKTHLLSATRRDALNQGFFFVLADMTDIRDFWETILVGFIRSLDQKVDGVMQSSRLIGKLAENVMGAPTLEELATARPPGLINRCNLLINALGREHRAEMREHQDILRALVLLASDDFDIQDRGQQWLQGMSISEDEAFRHGFLQAQKKPEQIVRGLSWLMSLVAPTVLALDQVDAIVAEHNLASSADKDVELTPRQLASLAIIQGLAGGLSALRDLTRSTLILVSCLEATWSILDRRTAVTMRDRFEPPILLEPIHSAASIRRLVELRLAKAYADHDARPPYPSFPFPEPFFKDKIGLSPREVLKACREHQLSCMAAGAVREVGVATPPPPALRSEDEVGQRFNELLASANVRELLERQDEEALDDLVEVGCEALVEENPLPAYMDALLDRDFAGTGSFEPLHARIRIVDHSQNDREQHYAFRFLEKAHHIAFQSRLKAAMTSAGIAADLEFRRLAIFRTRPKPSGALSERLTQDFLSRGGLLLEPLESELKVLVALQQLLAQHDALSARARVWLREARPVSNLAMFRDALAFLFPSKPTGEAKKPSPKPPEQGAAQPRLGTIHIGQTRGVSPAPVELESEDLKRHAAVLGGSGSGKTTLALSILEQLLQLRVPVLLVDRKGDLCRYGDPELRTDPRIAELLDGTDVAVFTPGQSRGRSLGIGLLPAGLEQLDESDRAEAYRGAAAGLSAMLRLKDSGPDQAKQAILLQAIRTVAQARPDGKIGLGTLIELIGSEDPSLLESLGHLDPKHCKKLAEQLQAIAFMRSEMFAASEEELSAELLFGRGPHASKRPRLSIISTKFLGDEPAVLFWVSQLLLELNRFASRTPSATLQAAVMFDEADLYLPATSKPPTKPPLESLLKRARSAGMSIMLATQSPGDLDYKCRENVRNWFIGLVKEPRALEKLKPLLSDAKLNAATVLPKQKVGQFFMLSEKASLPVQAERNLVETEQLSEPEIITIASATRG